MIILKDFQDKREDELFMLGRLYYSYLFFNKNLLRIGGLKIIGADNGTRTHNLRHGKAAL